MSENGAAMVRGQVDAGRLANLLAVVLAVVSTILLASCAGALGGPRSQAEVGGACAQPDAPQLEGAQVHYHESRNFDQSDCNLVRGKSTGDGCQYTSAHLMRGKEQTITEVQVAEDAATCRALFEVGTISTEDEPVDAP